MVYRVHRTNGEMEELHNPADMPDGSVIDHIEEPWIKATIMVPDDYLGAVLTLCNERRGQQADLTYVGNRAMAVYRLPLNEVVFDFYDRLKSVSRGYASFDYAMDGYAESDLVRISILVNQRPGGRAVASSPTAARPRSAAGRSARKLKDLIPRQLFKIAIQAAIGGRVIARETIGALSKDVTAKCYGGDISRKRKLLEKQKEGKKRMRQFGKVEIPQTRLPGRAEDGCLRRRGADPTGALPRTPPRALRATAGPGQSPGPPLSLDVPAKPEPHGRKHLLGKPMFLARAKAHVQRRRQHVRRHRFLDRRFDGPAALAGIRDMAGEIRQISVLRQRLGGQVEQPGRHHAAAAPEFGDVGHVEIVTFVLGQSLGRRGCGGFRTLRRRPASCRIRCRYGSS